MLGLHCSKGFNERKFSDRYIHCSLLHLQPREVKKPNDSRRQNGHRKVIGYIFVTVSFVQKEQADGGKRQICF